MEKNMQRKQQIEELKKEELKKQEIEYTKCSKCGYLNDISSHYCTECGSQLKIKAKECPVCGEVVHGNYCEFCGANVDGYFCKKCGKQQYHEFCPDCGEPLGQLAFNLVQDDKGDNQVREMSTSEAEFIIKDLHNSVSPEIAKELEKKRQRIILLRERQYFQEREKRIEEFYSKGIRKVKTKSHDEMKELKKSLDNLKKYINDEQQLKERKKSEYIKRVDGVWLATSGGYYGLMKLHTDGSRVNGSAYFKTICVERVDTVAGTWDGNSIYIKTVSIKTIWIAPFFYNVPVKYSARVNESGDTMSGYMDSAEYWQEIFIKQ